MNNLTSESSNVGAGQVPLSIKPNGNEDVNQLPNVEPNPVDADSAELISPESNPANHHPSPSVESTKAGGDTLLTSIVILAVITIVQKSLGFFRSVFVCRTLAPEEMGTWSMILTMVETSLPLFILSIPACFGRYFESFTVKRQLHAFVRQAFLIVLSVFVVCTFLVLVFRTTIASYVFGDPNATRFVIMGLCAIIPFGLFGVGCQMLTALRVSRLATLGNFIYGVLFTALAVSLLTFWNADANSMFVAFLLAHVFALVWVAKKLRSALQAVAPDTTKLRFFSTWRMLTPIILVFWINDFLTNLFFSVDRYMLINLVKETSTPVLAQIGNYESAHIIPALFATVTALVARTLLPYLSRDWETGKQDQVHHQINLSIKIAVVVLVLGSVVFLPASNWIFQTIFRGKYSAGQSILGYVLFFYVGNAVSFLLMNYFWCRQRGGVATSAMLVSLVVNAVANMLLIPSLGIAGAAIGTVMAVGCQMFCLYFLSLAYGLTFEKRMLTALCLPIVILIDGSAGWTGVAVVFGAVCCGLLFSTDDYAVFKSSLKKLGFKFRH